MLQLIELMTGTNLIINCVVQAQAFETFWAYYSQSGGQLYAKECRDVAANLVSSIELLLQNDSPVIDKIRRGLGEDTEVNDIIHRLKKWSESDESHPYEEMFKSRFMMFGLLAELKSLAYDELGISNAPPIVLTSQEFEHSERVVRWRGHMPRAILRKNPDEVFWKASVTPTIVVVGDIRRSQDLMTYAQEPTSFSERMVEFITKTRAVIEKHAGFFDKFTGDGFIVYFNEAVCRAAGKDFKECFIKFLEDELKFSAPLFNEWAKSIRKRPSTKVGLAIGADIGTVNFQDLNNHLVAVGDAIVWASRMASIGSGDEIIVNNLLFSALEGTSDISFAERTGQTKAGESFLAYILTMSNVGGDVTRT